MRERMRTWPRGVAISISYFLHQQRRLRTSTMLRCRRRGAHPNMTTQPTCRGPRCVGLRAVEGPPSMNVTSVSAARCYRANRDSWRHMAMRRSATALIEAASLTLRRADRTAFAKRRRPISVSAGEPSYSQPHSSHAASNTPRRRCSCSGPITMSSLRKPMTPRLASRRRHHASCPPACALPVGHGDQSGPSTG